MRRARSPMMWGDYAGGVGRVGDADLAAGPPPQEHLPASVDGAERAPGIPSST
jgi:hypothetical protein